MVRRIRHVQEGKAYHLARLIAVNAVSLVIAIIANIALLFNMARRIPFSIAQPITIIGWYISGFILVGLIAAVAYAPSVQLPPEQNEFLTQAFYYAILSAGLYIIVASLMVVTVIGAYRGHYHKDFNLTMSQRTLMLQTIAYLVYLLGGAAIFAHIEDWIFLNGVWWANFTLLTIGIGDFYPHTHLGQGLLFPYAIGGVVILGLVVGSIRSLVLERGEKKIAARIVEKKRERVVSQLEDDNTNEKKIWLGLSSRTRFRPSGKSEYHRRGEEFRLMRKIQEHADNRRKWAALLISTFSTLILWLVGAAIFWVAERNKQEFTYFESIYFAYTSLLTIGYGDYTLISNSGKPAFVFWSFIAIPTLTILISNMGDTVVKAIRDLTLYLGEITVLPGEGSTLQKVKRGVSMAKHGTIQSPIHEPAVAADTGPTEEPAGGVYLAEENRPPGHQRPRETAKSVAQHKAIAERLGNEFEAEELDEAFVAREHGDKIVADTHLYHYLLVKEIRNVMKDVADDPSRKYSYHEWAWFLRLLGEDENDPKFHRRPSTGQEKREVGAEGKGEGKGEMQKGASAGGVEGEEKHEVTGSDEKATPWSWVGVRSPLLGETEEAEWVLERLSEKLENELRAQRKRMRKGVEGNTERRRRPPVTEGAREEMGSPERDSSKEKESG